MTHSNLMTVDSVRIINLDSFAKKPQRSEGKIVPQAKIFLTFAKHFLYFVILLTIKCES